MPAAWAAWVIEAVEKWVTLRGDQVASDGWRCLGRAAEAQEPGWVVLDVREHPVDADTLTDVCLASETGPELSPSHLVDEYRIAHGIVLLREPPGLPRHSRFVWIRATSRRDLLDALRKGLRAAGPAPLAEALAAGALAGPPDSAVAAPPGFAGRRPTPTAHATPPACAWCGARPAPARPMCSPAPCRISSRRDGACCSCPR